MQEHKYSIKKWAKDDQPREKLLSLGVENLSNSELLSILLQNGTPQRTAVDIARDLLSLSKNNLTELGKLSLKEMTRIDGVGPAKAVMIKAAIELGRRRQEAPWIQKSVVTCSKDIAAYLQIALKDYPIEVFAILFLNQANKVNQFEIVSKGGITGTVADPRIILKRAIEVEAVSIVLCHNHPSGSLKPSRADEALTKKIKEAASLLDIRVVDHVIVSEEGFFSFADAGII